MKMLLPGERLGRHEGRQETLREGIVDNLEARFKQVPYAVRERILAIKSEPRLRELHRQAVLAESLEAFVKNL